MIKIENVVTPYFWQWDAIIRGMRNPMNSWSKSDSGWNMDAVLGLDYDEYKKDYKFIWSDGDGNEWRIGPNDQKLMRSLASGGSDDRKFMRMIPVYLDIVAPLYLWKELDTYSVGVVKNSCSTMHKIAEKEFELEDFSYEHLTTASVLHLKDTIDILNDYRYWYLRYDYMQEQDRENFDQNISCKKDLWWQMIQLLPSSYNQRRTVMLNYEVLKNMYHARKNHKLNEWRDFCSWIEALPFSELITGKKREVADD